jgi:redox-sensitive bicupin YhaK (pirin superfamily)
MMDQMGEVEYAPGEPKGTSWHPHRGFETVTYIMDGAFQHQDSHGGGGFITDGATQWMTAGGGILHIETPPVELVRSGGTFHGVQLWVNLPGRLKMTDPAYQNLEGSDVTLLSSHDGGALLRVIAGDVAATEGRARPARPSPACTPPSPRARSCRCRGSRPSTRWSTSCPARAGRASRAPRSAPARPPCSAPATT